MISRPYSAVLIVPTGIGASIGGYAGDALPLARAMAKVCDYLITHPNVLNGAQLYWPSSNILYVEGYGLDNFACGDWGLNPVLSNKVGLILDQGIESELMSRHIQAANAARGTLGLRLTDYMITDAPLGVETRIANSGTSWGTINNPGSLLRAAEKLIDKNGAEAIAIVSRFPDTIDETLISNYRSGNGVDPIAGAESIISHLIVSQFCIPAAHAPALHPLPLDDTVSPRSAAEELGYTFLSSVLVGLSRAPQFITKQRFHSIWADDIDALVVPATACGGSSIFSFSQRDSLIIAVTENKTTIDVPSESLGLKTITVSSYLEALGVLIAHKTGIDINTLSPNLSPLSLLTEN
ncbi:MAG: DUF3326 domain-containing protein [Candidatus Atelocyanobacterium thalassa]